MNVEKWTFDNDKAFIYFLLYKGEVVYVGKTVNFLSRIVCHQRTERTYRKWENNKLVKRKDGGRLKVFDEIYIKEVQDESNLEKYEQMCIKKFLPKYNTCSYAARQHKKRTDI